MPILGLRKSASVLGDAALGAGVGAGGGGLLGHLMAPTSAAAWAAEPGGTPTDFTSKSEDPRYAILGALIGGAGGAGLGALHGLGSGGDVAAARQAKLEDDRAKRDEALADDMVKRQRGISETFLTKYVMPRLAEQQGLVQPKAVKAAAVDKLHRLLKSAGPYDGVEQLAHYSHMPVGKKRELTPAEQAAVDEGQGKWFGKVFPSYSTPIPELMSSPLKGGLMSAVPGGLVGAVGGGLLGASLPALMDGHTVVGGPYGAPPSGTGAALGAALGGLAGGGATGLLGYFGRRQNNENLEDLMKRLPPDATRRDLLSDPAYQSDADRAEMAASTGSLGRAMLLSSLLDHN